MGRKKGTPNEMFLFRNPDHGRLDAEHLSKSSQSIFHDSAAHWLSRAQSRLHWPNHPRSPLARTITTSEFSRIFGTTCESAPMACRITCSIRFGSQSKTIQEAWEAIRSTWRWIRGTYCMAISVIRLSSRTWWRLPIIGPERGIADSRLPWGDLPYPYNTDLRSGKL